MNPTDLAISGPLLLATGVALLAGFISFASPCVVPLVPGYLAYLAGLVGAEAPRVDANEPAKQGRWRVAGASLLFVLGFTVVFALASMAMLGASDALFLNADLFQRIGGVVTILMGLVFIGLVPALQKDVRFHTKPSAGSARRSGARRRVRARLDAVPRADAGRRARRGAQHRGRVVDGARRACWSLAYCLGLGLPFVVLALGARWALGVDEVAAHARAGRCRSSAACC